MSGTAGEGTNTTVGTITASGANSQPRVLFIKTGSRASGGTTELTHVSAYIASGKLFVKTSTDRGNTWAGGGAAIWDPTAIDANDTVSDPCIVELRNGRVRICCVYYDDSAAEYSIRSIYSDDVAGAWSTNSNAGTTHTSGASNILRNPTMGQDMRTGRIWLAYERDTSGVANISVGSDADETGESFILTFNSQIGDATDSVTPTDQCEPVLWIAPNGIPLIVYVERQLGASGYLDLRYSVIGAWFPRNAETDPAVQYERYNRHIQRLTDQATHGSNIVAATDRVHPALCQAPTGPLYITYVVPGPSGGGPVDLYMLKVMDVVKMPIADGMFT